MSTIDQIAEAVAKMTPGKWNVDAIGDDIIKPDGSSILQLWGEEVCFRKKADAAAIVALRNNAEALLTVVRAAKAMRDHVGPDEWKALDAALARLA